MWVITKKQIIIAVVILVAILASVAVPIVVSVGTAAMPRPNYVVAIDAGHGGRDGGSVGKITGVEESYLNLKYAKNLESKLKSFSVGVVMTRTDMNGLYSPFASNKKRSDMQKRKEIIEKSNADLVISVHMNSYPTKSSRGAQVFYKSGDESGKLFANVVQNLFISNVEHSKKSVQGGDFYILNCTDKPGVIVEFGFLSNPEEEVLLSTEEHMEKLTDCVILGILEFLGA